MVKSSRGLWIPGRLTRLVAAAAHVLPTLGYPVGLLLSISTTDQHQLGSTSSSLSPQLSVPRAQHYATHHLHSLAPPHHKQWTALLMLPLLHITFLPIPLSRPQHLTSAPARHFYAPAPSRPRLLKHHLSLAVSSPAQLVPRLSHCRYLAAEPCTPACKASVLSPETPVRRPCCSTALPIRTYGPPHRARRCRRPLAIPPGIISCHLAPSTLPLPPPPLVSLSLLVLAIARLGPGDYRPSPLPTPPAVVDTPSLIPVSWTTPTALLSVEPRRLASSQDLSAPFQLLSRRVDRRGVLVVDHTG